MAPAVTADIPLPSGRNSPKPPPTKLWSVSEPPFEGFKPIDTEGYMHSTSETAIVIDNGSSPFKNAHLWKNADNSARLFCGPRWVVLRFTASIIVASANGKVP